MPVKFDIRLSDFGSFLEQFFLTVGQNNFGNKIPFNNQERTKPLNNPIKRGLNINSRSQMT